MCGVFEDEKGGPLQWRGMGRREGGGELPGAGGGGWIPWDPSAGSGTRPGTRQGNTEYFKQKRDVITLTVSQAHSPAVLGVDSK